MNKGGSDGFLCMWVWVGGWSAVNMDTLKKLGLEQNLNKVRPQPRGAGCAAVILASGLCWSPDASLWLCSVS